jgi:hypothetical protein
MASSLRYQGSPITVGVTSPAIIWSPFNWTGDAGRGGSVFRQTSATGAYFRFNWVTSAKSPTCSILFDTSVYGKSVTNLPTVSICLDGWWKLRVPVANSISVTVRSSGRHALTFAVSSIYDNFDRWGSSTALPNNVVRVTGIQIDSSSAPTVVPGAAEYALIVGDSITEGILAGSGGSDDAVYDYAHLLGETLRKKGYEYGMSGYSGTGMTIGEYNVPPYYLITGSSNGQGGVYNDTQSRWNKLDGHGHSLLDSSGLLSAYGGTGQAPAAIFINYGTNDALRGAIISDYEASLTQSLAALRTAAPNAWIFVIVPFSAHNAHALGSKPGGPALFSALMTAVNNYQTAHRGDTRVIVLDLGQEVSDTADSCTIWGTSPYHLNMEGHATTATLLLEELSLYL